MKKPLIILDTPNNLVWADLGNNVYYGERRIKSDSARAKYAIKLTKQLKGKLYSRYYGKYLKPPYRISY